ncbi:hypothetical protein L873DRAFT_1811839 [Choiromyces venosus 120613-1]|uniref:AB hydrolase-1 domain-containing protein n=1 Tax=Choiromyces venosus 120613-1 TaxID=1336337 RepID=A0A3N4JGU2_9PEZI|nr:hypothetical protein L873DRAFT_1811839 [Choiromyces venosus 120613-1]
MGLWSSRKPDDEVDDGDAESSYNRSRLRDPDETTRLLPPAAGHRHLDPDDPAVTPYNLLSVRSLRWVSIILLVISLLWWILLLISIFVTPPGMHSRGSGFFDFAYTTLATGSLAALLVFYVTPSRSEQYSWIALSILLLVDTIIILSVPRIRWEEGWVGIVSVIGATLVSAWAVLCDRVVEYGKVEEEERLTGRRETRRSWKEWLSVFAVTIILISFIALSVLFTGNLIIRAWDLTLTPPGTRYFVDNQKYEVHIFCLGDVTNSHGEKVTTALLEGGEDPVECGLEGWARDAFRNKTIDRYCYWDRPGMGFSENAPSPLSAGMAVDALSEALSRADETGPWVLVSHGVGGIYSRIFASRHTMEVKSLLLIDALPESQLERIGSAGRGFVLWLRGILSPLGVDRLMGVIFRGRSRNDRVIGRSAYQNPKQIKAKLQENLVATTFTRNEVVAARAILPRDIPFVVVSSGKAVKADKSWDDGQRELTELTDNLIAWDVVDHAPHEVWNDPQGRVLLEKRVGELVHQK